MKFLQNSSNCSGLYLGLLAAVVEALSTEGASLEKRLLSVQGKTRVTTLLQFCMQFFADLCGKDFALVKPPRLFELLFQANKLGSFHPNKNKNFDRRILKTAE